MKKLTKKNYEVYLFILSYNNKVGIGPSYKEIQEECNYKNIGSSFQAVDKLEDLKMITTVRNEKGKVITRSLKAIKNKYTEKLIEELKEKGI